MKSIFLLFISLTCGYNIDKKFPHIFASVYKFRNSYMGYTVYLYHEPVNNTSWLLMGAPKGNSSSSTKESCETGHVIRCLIDVNHSCTLIKPEEFKDKVGYIPHIEMQMMIEQQGGWFGSSMSIDKSNGILTVCAPRTVLKIFEQFSKTSLESMQGICYSGKITSTVLSTEYDDLNTHDFRSSIWYNPMYGFSIHYASVSRDEDKKDIHRIVGKPMHRSYGSVQIIDKRKRLSVLPVLEDDLSHFGYSVESGYFFKKSQLLYVSSAPGWQYVGQVAIIDVTTNASIVVKLQGTIAGEYFGASLAVGDINNDGLDDLIIGAPHWGQDNGKVYIYFGSSKGYFEDVISLYGTVEESYFGYAVASGDLDGDGFDDVIVGAPWEKSGVIYIYNGGSDLRNKKLQASQQIQPTDMLNNIYTIERFGFSISKPVDIDGNGYLDFAVGAYKSGHVMVFHSKPVVTTRLVISAKPNVLERDSKEFLIEVCSQHVGHNIESIKDVEFKVTVTVDEEYHRTKETFLEFKSMDLTTTICFKTQINISSNIRNFIEPISIVARHNFMNDTSNLFCKFCPIERRNNTLNVTEILLPFNIDCGPDIICNSNISATAKFHGVRDNDEWVIGSTYVKLNITLKNDGEPAYFTTIQFKTSKGVVLHSILPCCQEDVSEENLLVFCDVGNPLWKGEEKIIILDLDMKNLIHDLMHVSKLNFYITIETRSINEGMTNITKTLKLVNEVSLSLNGKSNKETYYLPTLKDAALNISFQHMYQVYKLGVTPIESAQLIIKIPTAINNSDALIDVYTPQLYISGQILQCFSMDSLLDSEQINLTRDSPIHDINMYIVANNIQQTDNLIYKRHVNKSDLNFDDTKKNVEFQLTNKNIENNILYMNCSISDVHCKTIICDLSTLKTLQDDGKVSINFVLNVEKLKDILATNKVALNFTTEATVNILKPTVRPPINGTRSTVELVTMFYNSPKKEELQLWIIITSVSVGLLLLIILVAVLSMLGFFKRQTKCCVK